jgi:hypothetical protein
MGDYSRLGGVRFPEYLENANKDATLWQRRYVEDHDDDPSRLLRGARSPA